MSLKKAYEAGLEDAHNGYTPDPAYAGSEDYWDGYRLGLENTTG